MTDLFAWLGGVLRGLMVVLQGTLASYWTYIVLIVAAVAAFERWLADKVIALTTDLFSMISGGGWHSGVGDPCGGGFSSYLAIANTFYPLDETFRMIFALIVGVWLPLGIYRLVKSYIVGFEGGS